MIRHCLWLYILRKNASNGLRSVVELFSDSWFVGDWLGSDKRTASLKASVFTTLTVSSPVCLKTVLPAIATLPSLLLVFPIPSWPFISVPLRSAIHGFRSLVIPRSSSVKVVPVVISLRSGGITFSSFLAWFGVLYHNDGVIDCFAGQKTYGLRCLLKRTHLYEPKGGLVFTFLYEKVHDCAYFFEHASNLITRSLS